MFTSWETSSRWSEIIDVEKFRRARWESPQKHLTPNIGQTFFCLLCQISFQMSSSSVLLPGKPETVRIMTILMFRRNTLPFWTRCHSLSRSKSVCVFCRNPRCDWAVFLLRPCRVQDGHLRKSITILFNLSWFKMEPVDIHKFEWRRFDFTTRFRELNRLHQQLQLIHKQLYLKDNFPTFANTKLFGSTDKETIEERKNAITVFLNFVLKNDVLCKARVFQSFVDVSSTLITYSSTFSGWPRKVSRSSETEWSGRRPTR